MPTQAHYLMREYAQLIHLRERTSRQEPSGQASPIVSVLSKLPRVHCRHAADSDWLASARRFQMASLRVPIDQARSWDVALGV